MKTNKRKKIKQNKEKTRKQNKTKERSRKQNKEKNQEKKTKQKENQEKQNQNQEDKQENKTNKDQINKARPPIPDYDLSLRLASAHKYLSSRVSLSLTGRAERPQDPVNSASHSFRKTLF